MDNEEFHAKVWRIEGIVFSDVIPDFDVGNEFWLLPDTQSAVEFKLVRRKMAASWDTCSKLMLLGNVAPELDPLPPYQPAFEELYTDAVKSIEDQLDNPELKRLEGTVTLGKLQELCKVRIVCVPGVVVTDEKQAYDLIFVRIKGSSGGLQDGTGHGTDKH
jgi:hypothetical protein